MGLCDHFAGFMAEDDEDEDDLEDEEDEDDEEDALGLGGIDFHALEVY